MLKIIKCKRCGKELSTLTKPIHTSVETMNKYQGICSGCITDREMMEMMLDMNNDVHKRYVRG